ncbi:Solute carrier family 7 member 13 [Aphelenchoides besseyi]|nr:Solute carrier family 7 member 13 [Aphelenchoides besseyi]
MFSVKTIVARFQIATTIAKIGSTYSGWDILCMGVSDIENPKRTLRLAVLIGMFVVSVVTIATNFSFFVVLSIPEILNSEAVATTFAQKTLGQAQYLMPFLICILLVGSINSTIYVGSRFLFSGACTNQLPSFLAISNKKHNSPRAAVFYHVVIGMLLTFTGNAVTLINSLSYVIWLQRAMSMVVILYIRFKNIPVHPGRVKMPLLLHFSFLLIILALVFTNGIQDPKAAVMGVGFLIVCLLIYFALVWDRALPRFDCYHHYSHLIGDKLTTMNGWLFDGIVDKTSDEAEEPINKE